MPTYSLTLRENIGRRLTIQEMDDNFLYLQQLAEEEGGGGFGIIPSNEIPYGSTSSGVTYSSNLTFNGSSIVSGFNNSASCDSLYSAIIGGIYNNISTSSCGSIISGGDIISP